MEEKKRDAEGKSEWKLWSLKKRLEWEDEWKGKMRKKISDEGREMAQQCKTKGR